MALWVNALAAYALYTSATCYHTEGLSIDSFCLVGLVEQQVVFIKWKNTDYGSISPTTKSIIYILDILF